MKPALKIAVYAIARNEQQFAHRFVDSVRDADHVIVCDTGSSDGTPDRLERAGARVYHIAVDPWRFDHARNVALSCVPSDVDACVVLDLDEVVRPGWREAIEEVWCDGVSSATATVIASDASFSSVRVHSRHGWTWEYPVHNLLMPTGAAGSQVASRMVIDHLQQAKAERLSRLPLHLLSVAEYPERPRPALYLTREYYYRGMWRECVGEAARYLSLELSSCRSPVERAAVMRWAAHALAQIGDKGAAAMAKRACLEAPDEREPWLELASLHYDAGRWAEALSATESALRITERPKHYLTEAHAWGQWPNKLAAMCSLLLKEFPNDLSVGERTGEHNSDEARIVHA